MDKQFEYEGEDALDASKMPKIRVVVRKRPLSSKEKASNDHDAWECRDDTTLIVKELKV